MEKSPEKARCWLRLSLVDGISRDRFLRLIDYFNEPENVFSAHKKDFQKAGITDEDFIDKLLAQPDDKMLDKEIELIEKHKVSIITINDEEYPINLKYCRIPPPMIYVKGKLDKSDRFAITIVGTRNPTEYGRWAAKKFASKLAEWGLTIVSGMAAGIDSVAHRASIAAKGRTIAVLGNGLAKCYPASNNKLMDEIADNGAVISEFPMETPPNAYNFPIRNEILAGLGLATFVIEASEVSGSLITAKIASEENRIVFALPGDINKEASFGTNLLIRNGAIPVISPKDILEDMSAQLKSLLKEYKAENLEQKIKNETVGDLSENEKTIYELIKHEPISIDAISEKVSHLNITLSELITILLKIELKGLIEKLPGQIYSIKG